MKQLIVCCDGTWNNPEQEENGVPAPTNVFKLYNALAEASQGNKQLKYYHPGVGGEGGLVSSIVGGAFGAGISRHICNAYHWLAENYAEGDQIYLFGFSRGAFTARSLGGFLGKGLLNLHNVDSKESWERVHTAFEKGYRKGKEGWAKPDWAFFHAGQPAPIRLIGVWDTVGALGIPDDLEILNFFDDKKNWEFHDTELGAHVQIARHAMAIDEIRSSFSVTRWSKIAPTTDAKEIWFPGVHSDVGGGYAACDLSNGALLWMMQEAQSAGLKFRSDAIDLIKAAPLGIMHNSYKGAFAMLRSRPRNIPALCQANAAAFHSSALLRQKVSPIPYPAYHPTKILGPGESVAIDIYAGERWNNTGLYLEKGHQYQFSATGEWKDSKDVCDWKGTQNDELTKGDIIRLGSSFLGLFEGAFKKVSKNDSFDMLWTKRVENLKWFVMIGAIANDSGKQKSVKQDGSPTPHQYVDLTKYQNKPLEIDAPGYLYCFPNDIWSLYDNNRGSVRLVVERVG